MYTYIIIRYIDVNVMKNLKINIRVEWENLRFIPI